MILYQGEGNNYLSSENQISVTIPLSDSILNYDFIHIGIYDENYYTVGNSLCRIKPIISNTNYTEYLSTNIINNITANTKPGAIALTNILTISNCVFRGTNEMDIVTNGWKSADLITLTFPKYYIITGLNL